jgi:hypothetical protein
VVLSPQFLVDCDNMTYPESGETGGCAGAMTQVVVDWISKNGMTTETCYPYFSGGTGSNGTCHWGECSAMWNHWFNYTFNDTMHWKWAAKTFPVDSIIFDMW